MKSFLTFLFCLWASIAFAQSPTSLCFTTNGANCVPVASSNPFPVTITGAVIGPVTIAATATNGSTTIISGGVAQNLFSSTVPTNGWTIINPDASEDCWASDTTTAAANATGSVRIAANGGGYETPSTRKPISAVSVICATTGHKLTASRW